MTTGTPQEPRWAVPVLKTLIFTLLVPATVTVYVPYWLLSRWGELSLGHATAFNLVGLVLIGLGALGYLWCAWDFTFTGKGTPAPIDPPKVLVARGLYRSVRNPMYVSVLLVLLGESRLFESAKLLQYALGFWIVFHLFVILFEEPMLKKKFGESYLEYCKAVPRWIPRVPAKLHR